MSWPYLSRSTPFGIAHRGGDTIAPENTMAAFAAAVEAGYTHLETDVHLTADDVLVAFHDDTLERIAGTEARIRDLTVAEVQSIEIGDGHRIPRMEELFGSFPDSFFNIDPKSDEAVEPLAALVDSHNMVDRVCIGSFSDDRIHHVRRLLGERLCTSPGPKGAVKVVLAALLWPRWSPPYGCLQVPNKAYGLPLDRSWLIRRIQRLGMQVHFWSINERTEMTRILDAGADAIITDKTDVLAEVLAERGASLGLNAGGRNEAGGRS